MPLFIKTEKFTDATNKLSLENKKIFLSNHKDWVQSMQDSGKIVASGYLVDENHCPGGGGLLILKADSFEEAKQLVKQDPMIINNLVIWSLQEWIPISDNLINTFILDY